MTPSKQYEELAARLTPPMRDALDRLCNHMVWADGRSVRALIARGLVANHGHCTDAMLGAFSIDIPTKLGREVHAHLRARIQP